MAVDYRTLYEACVNLDINNIAPISPLVDALDEHSKALAADVNVRIRIGHLEPTIWPQLHRIWSHTVLAHDVLDPDDEARRKTLRELCYSTARFTRNLVAAVPENQDRAFENEPAIRNLARHYTSFSSVRDHETFPVTRMLAQTLSNLVTANEPLLVSLWNSYLSLSEEQLIFTRLFAVPDTRTVLSAFVLVLNCLQGSKQRANLLVMSTSGLRLCIALMDRIAILFDEENSPDSSQAFELGYRIFRTIVNQGLVPTLYQRMSIDGEIIAPHQTTLLKLMDSYLQPSQVQSIQLDAAALTELSSMLVSTFFALSAYEQQIITRALGSDYSRSPLASSTATPVDTSPSGSSSPLRNSIPLEEVNLMLPKSSEALILVTQCLISLALNSEETVRTPTPDITSAKSQGGLQLRDYISGSASPSGVGSVECLIETLRLLDKFLPRITFGKVAPPPVTVEDTRTHRYTADSSVGEPTVAGPQTSELKGFAYLKRDLVRLLGILSSDCRAVQDRVRTCGGIPVVLNLCVDDKRNPYLREHAIFTLRNLLHGNLENQALVNEIQPLREWDTNGVLQRRGNAA